MTYLNSLGKSLNLIFFQDAFISDFLRIDDDVKRMIIEGKTSSFILDRDDSSSDIDFEGEIDTEELVKKFLSKMNRRESEKADQNMKHVKIFEKNILSKQI